MPGSSVAAGANAGAVVAGVGIDVGAQTSSSSAASSGEAGKLLKNQLPIAKNLVGMKTCT